MNRRPTKTSSRRKPTDNQARGTPRKQRAPAADSKVLIHVSAEDGAAALRALANRRPALIPEIEQIVLEIAAKPTFEDIANEVVKAFSELTMFDLARPNSANPFHYRGETESAWHVLEEAVQPFVETIRRLAKMGLVAAALAHCEGTLLGLYRSDRDQVGEFLDWVPDALPEIANEPLKALSPVRRRAPPGSNLTAGKMLKQFARENLQEWKWLQS